MASELKPCPACGKRVYGVHTCNPQLHVSAALLRVAKICEQSARQLRLLAPLCLSSATRRKYNELSTGLAAHARAIREGKIQEVGT